MVAGGVSTPAAIRTTGSDPGSRARLIVDLMGLVLVGLAAIWMAIVTAVTDTDASGAIALLVALALFYSCARAASRLQPLLVPAAVVGVAAALLLGGPARFLGPQPDAYPLGYANANAELLVHASVAALLIRAAASTRSGRLAASAAAIVLGVLPFAIGSLAAGCLGLVVLAIGLRTPKRSAGRATIAALGVLSAAALVVTIAAAATYRPGGDPIGDLLDGPITERRVVLWHESLQLMERAPVTGIGLGRFEYESPMARAEADIRWVPNAFLEQGAEAGVAGLVLIGLLAAWGFGRLYVAPGPGDVRAIGAAGWTVLGVHACMDYTVHFAAIPLVAAALLGATTSDNWE